MLRLLKVGIFFKGNENTLFLLIFIYRIIFEIKKKNTIYQK